MFRKTLVSICKICVLCIICLIVLLTSLVCHIFISNNKVQINNYSIYSDKLPFIFNDYKIALITDFHNSDNANKIIDKTKEISPMITVIVGDIINMNDTIFNNVEILLNGLLKISPVYFTSGNHETWSKNEDEILNFIKSTGTIVLNDEVTEIKYKNQAINLIGYKDIIYSDDNMRFDILKKELKDLYNKIENKHLFNILLFHRANYFEIIAEESFDLTLSGHLHNGHINLPIIQKRILLKNVNSANYTSGYYRIENSQMIISKGAEKNYRHPRVLNSPEVVAITLKSLK